MVYCPSVLLVNVYNSTDVVWYINYSYVAFPRIPIVASLGVAVPTATVDKRFTSLQKNQPLMTCAGLLATMTMISGAVVFQTTNIDY